jgi:hypothetical protein
MAARLLRPGFITRLFLTMLITDNALILRGVGARLRSRHTLLSAVLAALVLRTFQIVFLGHILLLQPRYNFNGRGSV